MTDKYVWYASYGSNINTDRFLCYIQGGKPKGSSKVETGCKDPSLPIASSAFTMHYPLYFAKEAAKWESGGVCFIGITQDSNCKTYSKKYLITMGQFIDVVVQENNGIPVNIDLNDVIKNGSKVFRSNAWYGNIMYLGEDKGHPIFTFTAPWNINEVEYKKPSHAYLRTIIEGLKDHYSNDEIYRYLETKDGIKGHYTPDELKRVIF